MGKNIQSVDDHRLVKLLICSLSLLIGLVLASGQAVPITYLESAKESGAVCLNGSPPAYYYDKGSGEGANNWIVRLEGGGWCSSDAQCHDDTGEWKKTWTCNNDGCADSYKRSNNLTYGGIFSGSKLTNPDFYNWNRVHVVYCDGGSFYGDVEEVNPAYNITRRGARIYDAVINDLLNKGMRNAENAILTGYSAGGLATVLHCDKFRNSLPNTKRVKCIVDSGFFIHAKKLAGATDIREKRFNDVAAYHGMEKTLPQTCTSKMPAGWCLFPENLIQQVQTPLFLVDSMFDAYQLPAQLPYLGSDWSHCVTADPNTCLSNKTLLQPIKNFRRAFLKTLPKCGGSIGMFIDSCQVHGHCSLDDRWTHFTLKNKSLNKAVGDWFFDRSYFCEIDMEHAYIQNLQKCITT